MSAIGPRELPLPGWLPALGACDVVGGEVVDGVDVCAAAADSP